MSGPDDTPDFHHRPCAVRLSSPATLLSSLRTLLPPVAAVVFLAWVLGGCGSTSPLDSVTSGKTLAYQPGVPNFNMETIPTRAEGESGVDVHLGMPYTSLVWQEDSTGYSATYEFVLQAQTGLENANVRAERRWTDTLFVEDYEQTQSFESITFTRRIDLEPGDYVFRAVLEDRTSDRRTIRSTRVDLPDLTGDRPVLTPIHLETRRSGRAFEPVVALHVAANVDSLRTVADLYNASAAEQTQIRFNLVRYRSDQTRGAPPDGVTPLMGSLEYQGIDYGRGDTVRVSSYSLGNPGDPSVITFDLSELNPGIYQAQIVARMQYEGDSTEVMRERRTVSVKAPNFPRIASLEEMVKALTYIAYDDEIEAIRRPRRLAEKREEFDAFWGELVGNEQQAQKLIENYYSRVEEANRFFTSQKEGWKTDRGMIYIVLGPPIEVNHYVDTEVWRYGYGGRAPENTFIFERGHNYDGRGPLFNNYILQRRSSYRNAWRRAVQEWRDGSAPRGGA